MGFAALLVVASVLAIAYWAIVQTESSKIFAYLGGFFILLMLFRGCW